MELIDAMAPRDRMMTWEVIVPLRLLNMRGLEVARSRLDRPINRVMPIIGKGLITHRSRFVVESVQIGWRIVTIQAMSMGRSMKSPA